MVLSEAQYSDAILEARRILKLGQKWQELMPNDKRPNFERAAREILKRAMSHRVERNEEPLDIRSDALMHEQNPREAQLTERWLRSGTVHADALHSFQSGRERAPIPEPRQVPPDTNGLTDFEVYVRQSHTDQTYPGHFHTGKGTFLPAGHSAIPQSQNLRGPPAGAVMEKSDYEAVH